MVAGNAAAAGLSFKLDFGSTRPIYLQIIDEVKRAVARGDLQPGDRLPSQRELAELARVNPNTVQRAFREMEVTGLVETVRGQGTFLRNDPGLVQEVRLEMAQMAVVQFVKEMQRLGLGLAEAIGLVRRMWDGQGQGQDQVREEQVQAEAQIQAQAQEKAQGQAQDQAQAQVQAQAQSQARSQVQSQVQSRIHGQIQSQVPGQVQDQTGADASGTGTRPGEQDS